VLHCGEFCWFVSFFFSIDACNPFLHHRKTTPLSTRRFCISTIHVQAAAEHSTLDLETDASGPNLKPASV
jgi:hypothetical protein